MNNSLKRHVLHCSILTTILHIHQGNNGVSEDLNWRTRVRVAVEAAQGMMQQNERWT